MIVLVDELPFLNQIPMIIQVERWNCFTSSEMFQRLTVLELLYFLWQCFTSIFELQSGFVWSTQWSFYYLLLLLVWAEWLSNETMRKSAWIAAPPPGRVRRCNAFAVSGEWKGPTGGLAGVECDGHLLSWPRNDFKLDQSLVCLCAADDR